MRAAEVFLERFGSSPTVRSFAPGRIEFIGNHVDYNGGPVLGAAIDRGVEAAASIGTNGRVRLYSAHFGDVVEADLDRLAPLKGSAAWANYPLGVAWALAKHGCSVANGFNMVFDSDLPAGAGLSSSAAIELATATALNGLFDLKIERQDMARWCREAENEFAGMPCGILDQGTSAFGQAGRLVLIDCRNETFGTVPLPEALRFWIFNTGKKHALLDSLYATRRRECEEAFAVLRTFRPDAECLVDIQPEEVVLRRDELRPELYRRAMHIVNETQRVRSVSRALEKDDINAVGRLLVESHASSRDLFENSCAELDFLVERLVNLPEVYGARLTGGGFGGAVMAMTTARFSVESASPVMASYAKRFGIEPAVFSARTGDGSHVLAR